MRHMEIIKLGKLYVDKEGFIIEVRESYYRDGCYDLFTDHCFIAAVPNVLLQKLIMPGLKEL